MVVLFSIRQAETIQDRILLTFNSIHQKYIERKPKTARVYQVDDLLIYRAKGILSPAEARLITDDEGGNMLRGFMIRQWDELKPVIRHQIQKIVNHSVLGITVDVCVEEDEIMIICRMAK
jgi:uncharacterized protein YbcI